jgi:hypothetical protein
MQFEGIDQDVNSHILQFDHQIAGHINERIRKYDEKFILKPLNKRDLFDREVSVYEKLLDLYQNSCPFFVLYYGILSIPDLNKRKLIENEEEIVVMKPCLVLEDLTMNYCRPCLIDIKMGRQTFEPTANYEKIARELKKYPYQEEIGFRITGMKVWDQEKQCYSQYDKYFGRSLLPEMVFPALSMFFHNGNHFRKDVLIQVLEKLQKVLLWMKNQSYFKFFCSSILIVYDGLIADKDQDLEDEEAGKAKAVMKETELVQVKMIDFAHVTLNHHLEHTLPKEAVWEGVVLGSHEEYEQDVEETDDMIPSEIDEGYIHGVTNLMGMLAKLRDLVAAKDELSLDNLQEKIQEFFSQQVHL